MSTPASQPVASLTVADLEALVRRVAKEAVHEELGRLSRREKPSILDDWSHEGADDPEGDEELLQDALALLTENEGDQEAWMSWEEFEAELDRAEAAGELPN